MIKKLILICLIGFIGLGCLATPALATSFANNALWLAQTETPAPTSPSDPSSTPSPKATTPPTAAKPKTTQQTTTSQQASSVQSRSQTKPFNPYDMEALRQFDAGDHRSK